MKTPLLDHAFLGDSEAKEAVDHPAHYNQHQSGVECITIVQEFNFNVGTAIKHLWRIGLKPPELTGANADAIEDLRKAAKYIEFEIARLQSASARERT